MKKRHTVAVCKNGHIHGYKEGEIGKRKVRKEIGIEVERKIPLVEPVRYPLQYCTECGGKVLTECPECEHPIETEHDRILGDETDRPNFCAGCGAEFPWTTTLESIVSREDRFIDVDLEEIGGHYYPELVHEINLSFQVKADHATLVLNRKLIESLLYDILKGELGIEQINEFFDTERGQHRGLKDLIDNLKGHHEELRKHSQALDGDFYEEIRELKHDGDSAAHVIEDEISEDELANKSEKATRIVKVLFTVRQSVRSTPSD